jgi:hypothetical protein
MSLINVSVINACSVLTDSDIQPVVDALQKQVDNDFGPAWGVDAKLSFVPQGGSPPAGSWWLLILDDSDQAGALGYHDLTSEGLPLGKVFAGTDLKFGTNWTVTASHELLEMLGDPNINLTVFIQNNSATGRLYAYEVCDACESDQFGYLIGNVLVSDFVYPAWFEDFRAANSTQFDQGQRITQPLQLLAGGYIGMFDVTSGSGWQQLTARKEDLRIEMRGNVGSRRERRRTLREQWLRSRPHPEITKNAAEYRARIRKAASKAA